MKRIFSEEHKKHLSESLKGRPHLKRRGVIAKNRSDLVGKRFGRLLVVALDSIRGNGQNTYWKCICDCGKEKVIGRPALIRRDTKSCGCLIKEKLNYGLATTHGCARYGKATQEYGLWNRAKKRALKKNLEFSVEISDIVVPDKCPLLGIPLILHSKNLSPGSPSLDRINPKKGYSKDNIWVVSSKANTAKQDLMLNELKMLVENLEHKIVSQRISEDRKSYE